MKVILQIIIAYLVLTQLSIQSMDESKSLDPFTWLMDEIENNSLENVQEALKLPIDINCAEKGTLTPLQFACQENNSAIVKRLLQTPGIDANKQTSEYHSALFIACWNGNLENARLLLEHQPPIDINTRYSYEIKNKKDFNNINRLTVLTEIHFLLKRLIY